VTMWATTYDNFIPSREPRVGGLNPICAVRIIQEGKRKGRGGRPDRWS
jgi:hypothetical protein